MKHEELVPLLYITMCIAAIAQKGAFESLNQFHCNFTPFRFGISMTQASIFEVGNSSLRPRPGKLKDDYMTNPTYKSNYVTEMSKIGEMNLQIYSII